MWYRLSDAPEWRTLRVLDKTVMEATVQHLLPGREYELMVLSQDKYGDGMFSKQLRYETKGKYQIDSLNRSIPLERLYSLQLRHCMERTLTRSNCSISRTRRQTAAHWELPGT